jgi:phosphodiesterase/alkaline phosphatase D-like protein
MGTHRSSGTAIYRSLKFGLLAWLCIAAFAQLSSAANLMRGPYLQLGTPTSVVVRWRTDVATNSLVRYGLVPGSLTSTVDNLSSATEHVMTISGLSPNTTYYYSVGSTTETLSSGPDHLFLTAPASGKPTRVWIVGDSGTANTNVLDVRDAYKTFTGSRHTDLWMMLGDNA